MDVTKAPPSTDLASSSVGSATSATAASESNSAAGASAASNTSVAVTAVADRVDIQPLDVAAALQILVAEVRAELPALQPATPLSPLASAQAVELPTISRADPTHAPAQESLAEAPDLAPMLLRPAPPASAGETATGASAAPAAASVGGAGPGGALPPLPSPWFTTPEPSTGGWLPLTSLRGIQPSLDFDPLEPLLTPPGVRLAMPSALTLLSSPAQASPVLMRMFLQAVPQEAINPAAWSAAVNQLEGTLQSALDRAVATVEQWHDVPQAVVDAARETRGLVMAQLGEDPPGPLWLRPEWMWLSPQIERFRRRRRLVRRGLSDPDLWPLLREDDGRRDEPAEGKDDPAKPEEEH